MIIVYPMIVSSSVSSIALPIVCKALEKYIIIYRYDSIIERANALAGPSLIGKYKVKNRKIVREEYGKKAVSGGADNSQGGKSYKDRAKEEEKKKREEEEKKKKDDEEKKKYGKKSKGSEIRANHPELKTLQLEPTWITVQIDIQSASELDKDGKPVTLKRTELIGIKVVPTVVKSDDKLANMLLYDKQANFLHGIAIRIGRTIIKKMYKYWDNLIKKLTWGLKKSGKSGTVTGDARKDIVHHRTDFDNGDRKNRSRIFVCLSSIEITDDFFLSAKGINGLFKMGWNNVVIVDDVNRLVHFCTMEYKGQCAPMSFAALYNSFDAGKVYGTLDEIAKSSGSLFKRRFSAAKIQSNILASQKLNKYRG